MKTKDCIVRQQQSKLSREAVRRNVRNGSLFDRCWVLTPLAVTLAACAAAPAPTPSRPPVAAEPAIERSRPSGPHESIIELHALREKPANVQIGSGGFEAKIRSGTLVDKQLRNCADAVGRVATSWQATNHLLVLKRAMSPTRFLLHVQLAQEPGFFEVFYAVDPELREAQVSVEYFLPSGQGQIAPDLSEKYGLVDLGENLLSALSCAH